MIGPGEVCLNSFNKVFQILQIDEKQKAAAQKVQINIGSRDSETSAANRNASRAPNVNVKTPIVVKRIEPGKQPVLSEPSNVTKPTPQVSLIRNYDDVWNL